MEWKDHNEENLKMVVSSMKENGHTAESLSEGTAFGCDFVEKVLSGTMSPGPKLQEIILLRCDLAIADGKVLRK